VDHWIPLESYVTHVKVVAALKRAREKKRRSYVRVIRGAAVNAVRRESPREYPHILLKYTQSTTSISSIT
jgi:hypothetical protein